MVLVTKKAPDFDAAAVLNDGSIINNFNFTEYSKNNITVIFFWPLDFTFVCPSEIISINNHYNDFSRRNVKILGISCDSQFTHNAWRNTSVKNGGIGKIKFIMISDLKKEIQKKYGIEYSELGIALRASFLIDKKGIIRHQLVNDLPFGRNVNEMIRMIDALNHYEKYGEVCPAQWEKGKKSIIPTSIGIADYLTNNINELN
ncbi:redoxin domain-containing protein [Enterobacteriaceae endosymbiont of Plateumaris braccata]|uniref:redoxin domain-containing protein n=1 Tax=Enterobacteriaceae endosymbiont of Plateumaris braccata TaxID=2675793 RepID=UPI001448A9D1|nr:redoxin domain-containing protein [Enterobacteriaceae endosymbiont of Plateumaris braccata]QJC28118.1 redoxin domain-containing protein [Enterobacteriaceae endosymbiont of Plateumaris braccata]